MQTIEQSLEDLAADFDLLETWEAQLEYVRDLGKTLEPLSPEEHTSDNKVRGCASQLWMVTDKGADGRLRFRADSDAIFSKGLAAVMIKLVSGHRPEEIMAFDLRAAFERLGLPKLSMSRANGLASMAEKVKTQAAAALV